MYRILAGCLIGSIILLLGCRPDPATVRPRSEAPKSTAQSREARPPKRHTPEPVRVGEGMPAKRSAPRGEQGELTPEQAARLAWEAIEQSATYSPTLVVWLFDETSSAQNLVSRVTSQLELEYDSWAESGPLNTSSAAAAHRLATAIVGYSDQTRYLLETPSADPDEVVQALKETRIANNSGERLFSALSEVLDKYLPHRPSGGRLLLGIVTDEMGDDWQRVDELVPRLRRESVGVYVIGPPAPFGMVQALRNPPETPPNPLPSADYVAYRQGPETRYVERVISENPLGTFDLSLMDSGFGPFALEWICRASGGAYLAIRPRSLERYRGLQPDVWPSPYAPRFPPAVMQRYLPDYVTEEQYRQLLEQNAAARALHQAAQAGTIRMLQAPQLVFAGKDEAEINRIATVAQQQAALAIRSVDEIYNLLKNGEKDRDNLTSPRWQASFDLAYGQACLAKAQIDSYNSMLARLKRGMKFENPSSTMWVLEPANEFPESLLQNIAQRGQELLKGIQQNHPNTPWALIAEQTLQQPPGWRWTEK
ncbi:MAG: hypothetical protein KatS3mg110_2180 [Pirellulaceae bacterium]|nr:MAG: hypothetical protein KatS3mg110_2180 [Pirellulaceae bacterium]